MPEFEKSKHLERGESAPKISELIVGKGVARTERTFNVQFWAGGGTLAELLLFIDVLD
jgi:hypothetical protein